jgi:plasmid stabilization system protein ParE
MPGYRLSKTALKEVGKIISDLHADVHAEAATSMESQLFAAFSELGRFPRVGHPRPDLTSKRLLFYNSKPYMIAFRVEAGRAMIVRVVHGARDLSKLF